jgi:hypothetical protein
VHRCSKLLFFMNNSSYRKSIQENKSTKELAAIQEKQENQELAAVTI